MGMLLGRLLGEAPDGLAAAPGQQHRLLAVGTLPAEAVAVAWAQACDGILVSDTGAAICTD